MHRNETEAYYLILRHSYTLTTGDIGKTITFKVDINSQLDGDASLQLNTGSVYYTAISKNTIGRITVSTTIPSGISTVQCILAFSGQRTGKLYTDNWNITIA